MQPRIVMHPNFLDIHPAQLQLSYQFDANRPGRGLQMNEFQQAPPDQTEIAIDIPQAHVKQKPRKLVIGLPNPDPVPRVVSFHLVAVDKAYVCPHPLKQLRQLTDVVLPIAIGIKDKLFGCRFKPASQRTPIAPVHFMCHDPHLRPKFGLQLEQNGSSRILTAIVYYDHFEIGYVFSKHGKRLANQSRQG